MYRDVSCTRYPRRHFLRRVLGTTAGLSMFSFGGTKPQSRSVSAASDESASKEWKLSQACSSIAFSSLPIEEAIARIAKLGFDAIDIWSAHAGCPHLDDVLDRLGPERLLDLLEKHDLSLYSFSVYQGGYPKYAKLLGRCGGGIAVRGSEGKLPASYEETKTRMKQFIESLRPELELCEQYDSRLAIENHGNALLHTLDSMKLFTEMAAEHPRLGVALAPYHVQSLPQEPVRRLDRPHRKDLVPKAIRICGDQLFFIYMWQKPAPGDPPSAQLPGIGPVDMSPWLAELRDIDYRYPVTPFMHHEPEPNEMTPLLKRAKEYLDHGARRLDE